MFFFLGFYRYQKAGREKVALNQVISVSFVVDHAKPTDNPGTPNVADRVLEKEKNAINEKQKEQRKKERAKKEKPKEKTFESKMATKDAKVVKTEKESPSKLQEDGKKKNNEEDVPGNANPFYGSNFQANGDGSYTALSSEGISYEILREIEPNYPSQAESISYDKKIKVKVKFLVGLQGNVEDIQLIISHKKLGFDDEVMRAVEKWRFKPIHYAGKNIKVYFVKEFIFNPR